MRMMPGKRPYQEYCPRCGMSADLHQGDFSLERCFVVLSTQLCVTMELVCRLTSHASPMVQEEIGRFLAEYDVQAEAEVAWRMARVHEGVGA